MQKLAVFLIHLIVILNAVVRVLQARLARLACLVKEAQMVTVVHPVFLDHQVFLDSRVHQG